MRQALRPYATTGIALVGAGLITATPVIPPPADPMVRVVRLADSWSDLINDTTANVNNIIGNANWADISKVIGELFTNPLGVIGAFTNVTPDITTDLTSLPATISVQLPPGLELAIASLGSQVATDNAIQQVIASAGGGGGFGALFNGLPTILNAYLNGTDNISLLDGSIVIPAYNGVLAPLQPMDVDLSLTKLVDALGLGDLKLTDLDLTSLLNQLGLGNLDLGGLFSSLGLSGDKLGDLLGDPTLGGLLGDLGLGGLGLGSFKLTDLLDDLGLNSGVFNLNLGDILQSLGFNSSVLNVDLLSLIQSLGLNANTFDLSLTDVLNGLGLNSILPPLDLSDLLSKLGLDEDIGTLDVGALLDNLGLGNLQLGDLLDSTGLLNGLTTQIFDLLKNAPLIGPALSLLLSQLESLLTGSGGIQDILNDVDLGHLLAGTLLGNGGVLDLSTLLGDLGLTGTTGNSLSISGLLTDLLGAAGLPSADDLTIGGLLGDLLPGTVPLTGSTTIGGLLSDVLGGNLPVTGDLSIGDILNDLLGAANLPSLDDLTLGGLLGDLGGLGLHVGDLLNSLDLGGLLDMLNLSNLPLDLGDLGDLSNLTLGGLLGDLGLGDLASISVEPFGGYYTELFDVVPQQILDALGG